MKKTLLSLALITLGYVASAQCVVDPNVSSGMSPDTIQGMQPAFVGQIYQQDFTLVVPSDTTFNGFPVTIEDVFLIEVDGLPTEGNFDYDCSISNCTFPGGSSGCARVFTPSIAPLVGQIGSYPLTIVADAHISGFAIPSGTLASTLVGNIEYDGYYLVIAEQTPVSVEQVGNNQMKSLIAYPNPTNGNTTIEFAMGYNSEVTFTVTNLLGASVNVQNLSTTKGLNRIQFDATNVPNGVYFYTITDGKNTISKKLIVSK